MLSDAGSAREPLRQLVSNYLRLRPLRGTSFTSSAPGWRYAIHICVCRTIGISYLNDNCYLSIISPFALSPTYFRAMSVRGKNLARRADMPPSCPYCDQPDISLLRLVLIGEILRADETRLVWLADLLETCGLTPPAAEAAEPEAPRVRLQQGTRQGAGLALVRKADRRSPHAPCPLNPVGRSRSQE